MRITLVTIGSRGDVYPYVALGKGLRKSGHQVRVATHERFEPLIRRHDLEFGPVVGDPRDAVESDAGQAWLGTGGNPAAFGWRMAQLMRPMMKDAVRDCWAACRDADLVLCSLVGWLPAQSSVDNTGTPCIPAFLQPVTPTRSFPAAAWPAQSNLGAWYNLLTYRVGDQALWHLFRSALNEARRDVLGLGPLPLRTPMAQARRRGDPVLYGYSPTVVPPPPDWPPSVTVTGYWVLEDDRDWRPPPDLSEFLGSEPAPVYVGFGSMHQRSAPEITQTVVAALEKAGRKGILLTGWGGLSSADLPEHVYPVESVPHEWLFPRVGAVVHHCGAGTTAAGLRAGVPTVPLPFFGDQPFWARRLYQLGVATTPIPVRHLSADRLAEAIVRATTNREIRDRAARIGERLRMENGVARAVEAVDALQRR